MTHPHLPHASPNLVNLTSAFVRQSRRETKNPWEGIKINIVRTAYSVSVSECGSLSSMPLFECLNLSQEMSKCHQSNDNRSQCNVKINLHWLPTSEIKPQVSRGSPEVDLESTVRPPGPPKVRGC